MEESLKLGDHFDYDFGDETDSLPIETVVIHIDGKIAIVKVISMYAECEEFTAKYDDVVEYFPDFTDPKRNFNSRYLFLDMETLSLFDDPMNYYAMEELEDDETWEDTDEIDETWEDTDEIDDN